MNRTVITGLAFALSLGGCTWVKLTEEGEAVAIMAEAPASCKRLGQTSSQTKSDIASIDRNREKVGTELETLARNAAAGMGGDLIVPESEVSDSGQQSFAIYRCGT